MVVLVFNNNNFGTIRRHQNREFPGRDVGTRLGKIDFSGQIIFENKVINDQPIFERPFNTVFQDYALFPNMNVFNNVGFGWAGSIPASSSKSAL